VDPPVALVLALAHLLVVLVILLISIAWGARMLEHLGYHASSHLESILFAAGFSIACLEIALFVMAATGALGRITALALLGAMAVTAGRGWRQLTMDARSLWDSAAHSLAAPLDRAIAVGVAVFLALEALLAMAPLTGSDAMHYHFTVPLLEQGRPLTPIFTLTHSFFTGQAHLLISLGLALGSDRISLGLIYLGGLLSAAALFAIARQLMPLRWAWTAALTFAATPLVFWQMSTSGSPDMWMGLYIALAALAAARAASPAAMGFTGAPTPVGNDRWFVLAGFFAGAAAGVKYTGWVVPFALVAYVLVIRRSLKWSVGCGLAALIAGIWPLARNWTWTGDPVFPFLSNWLSPGRANAYALAAIGSMTRSEGFARDITHLLQFPFLLVLNGNAYGLGQFFGPLVLAFSPLLIFASWEKPLARFAAFFWTVMFLSILFSSQMGRFLLPVYALSLVLVLSGAASIRIRNWKVATAGCGVTIATFLMFAAVSDALYARDFLPVVLEMETKDAFLERMAPDYRPTEFINRTLQPRVNPASPGNVMVFFRHLYYLRVPFVEGAPDYSWPMDPAVCSDPEKLLAVLHGLNVRWVVKSPDYPAALAAPFSRLEEEGKLAPIASEEVENLTGTGRMYRQKEKVRVVILKLGGN
jgi:dolichyl-phosphate-mannose-protein mannosyltransferase/uncharacterized protein DUF1420